MGKSIATRLVIPLPRSWPRFAKSGLIHAVALARVALLEVLSGLENSRLPRARLTGEVERLRARVAALEEEIRIKDARMARLPPARRPHYPPEERLAILALRAAQGWNTARTARRFLLAPGTVAGWMKRLDEEGEDALVRMPVPVNRFPDFLAVLVQQLRRCAPRMGRKRIANVLARAGLHLAPSTVRRMLRKKNGPAKPPPPAKPATPSAGERDRCAGGKPPRVRADSPHHVWHVDLTVVPTLFGFWAPWLPQTLAQLWPFAWWIAVVLDHFSRAPVASAVFKKEPTAEQVCALLDAAVDKAGRAPRYVVSDKGVQFRSEYRDWCRRRGVRPRYGALGKHGSIAVIERYWHSLKSEYLRLVSVPLSIEAMRRQIEAYIGWYLEHRPHESLGGATPAEVLGGRLPAAGRPPLEVRARGRPRGALRRQVTAPLALVVTPYEGRAELPVVELREAA